jgi:hypothetical protein
LIRNWIQALYILYNKQHTTLEVSRTVLL